VLTQMTTEIQFDAKAALLALSDTQSGSIGGGAANGDGELQHVMLSCKNTRNLSVLVMSRRTHTICLCLWSRGFFF